MGERFIPQGDLIVLDRETGLMWQRGASKDRMVWKDGFSYVDVLNKNNFAGHRDWRYPSKEEMASLILPDEDRHTGNYTTPLFGPQRCFWTSTEAGHHRAVYVDFYYGDVYVVEENYANHFIRAVRNT
jgi:serine/threonine-protein kinase